VVDESLTATDALGVGCWLLAALHKRKRQPLAVDISHFHRPNFHSLHTNIYQINPKTLKASK
jgi:hypothetical protein